MTTTHVDDTTAPQVDTTQRRTILAQVGRANRAAIDGLRPAVPTWRGVELICGNGYRVRIDLEPNDTYTVRRLFRRAGRYHLKGELRDVHNVDLPEVAYRAGMFRDPWPAGGAA